MFKHGIRMSLIFSVGLSIVLILLLIILLTESVESIRYLGNSSIKINSASIKERACDFLKEAVERSAGEFSGYFNGVGDLTVIAAAQLQKEFNSAMNKSDLNNVKLEMADYKKLGLQISEPAEGVTAYYWGQQGGNEYNEMLKHYQIVNNLFPYIENLMKANAGYFFGCWINGQNYNFTFPRDNFYKKVKDIIQVEYYFNVMHHMEKINPSKIEHSKAVWLMPYVDLDGKFCLSVYTPIYDINGKYISAFGIDLNLNKILEIVLYRRLTNNFENLKFVNKLQNSVLSFMFLVDSKGNIIVFPEEGVDLFSIKNEYSKYFSPSREIQANLGNSEDRNIQELVKNMMADTSGVRILNLKDRNYVISYSKLNSPDWCLGLVVPESILTSFVDKTKFQIEAAQNKMTKHFIIIALIFLIISILLIIAFFRYFFILPLKGVIREIKKIGKGHFDIKLPNKGAAEIVELSSAFEYLGHELKLYTESIEREVRTKQEIDTELKVAAEMQKKILPKMKDIFKRNEFELFARLDAAKIISGDFYDYFYIDNDKLAIVVADVSGKGLKPAYFMAMSKVLLKSTSLKYPDDPAKVLTEVNELLYLDNKTHMFVTVFLVFYNISSGEIIYANGGHHESLIVSKDKTCRRFGLLKNMALGCWDKIIYNSGRINMNSGDILAMFTDGVLEAFSPDEEEFGEDRLEDILIENKDKKLSIITEFVFNEIQTFEMGEQSDDITFVLLKRN